MESTAWAFSGNLTKQNDSGTDPMATLPKVYSLDPLLNALLRQKKDKRALAAGNALKIFRDAKSALNDLAYAKELSDHLAQHDPGKGTQKEGEPVSVRGSILQHAILLCVRAVEVKQRRGLKIRSQLSEPNKKALAGFIQLRNKAIAHFDNARPYRGNSFADDVLVTVHLEDGERFDLADSRVVYQTQLETDLRALIEQAMELGASYLSDALDDVVRHLSPLSRDHREIGDMILKHPFDVVGFFGEEEEARQFLLQGAAHDEPKTDITLFEGWPDRQQFSKFNIENEERRQLPSHE